MKFKGLVEVNKKRKNSERYDYREFPNLLVDDGKEYILDFLGGIKTWHKPQNSYSSGVVDLWTWKRFAEMVICMFNNSSTERVNDINGVPSGQICSYPISTTMLVSPEDSFLSKSVGNRIQLTVRRVDQTLEFIGTFQVPGNIPSGSEIREFGLFLRHYGPSEDPSFLETQKPFTMLCRTTLWGSGVCGGTGVYTDNPLVANDDIEIRWKFGEI